MDFIYEHKKDALPAMHMLIGKVVANYDDKFKGMVKVAYHAYEQEGTTTDWMRVLSPAAGKNKGIYFLPEVGDEVAVSFIGGDVNNPCVIGVMWNEQDTFPKEAVTEKNTTKLITTKSGIQLAFSDEEGKESLKITTPGKANAEITLSDEKESIFIKCGGSEITINGKDKKILLNSAKTVNIEAENIEFNAKSKLSVTASNIEIKANASLKAEASGIAEIKGSMVKING
jgi:uncharacterized protein involved in type VI secretion and phage assembly